VRRINGVEVFTLEQDADRTELQAMALAAQELRMPLANVMTVADRLFPVTEDAEDPAVKEQVSQINRGLFQMLRIISNMSDAYRYDLQKDSKMAVANITAVVENIFQHSTELLHYGGKELTFESMPQPVFGLIDQEKLERAIHNIISNAVKFSAREDRIYARLSRKGNMLYLTVQGEGDGKAVQGNIHSRFRRQPGLEDSRFGIGLGMVMIRAAAAAHGGTVLISHLEEGGTKLTMSIAINQDTEPVVRNRGLSVDYAGERDHTLIELSDVLPTCVFESEKIN
jgi:K+-sensing histidine kinase KdpD